MATTNPGLVAVTDMKTAGAIVWWRLSGEVDRDRLVEAWKAAGLDEKLVPAPPSPVAALRRAAESLEEKRRLVRPLQGQKGWAVVIEKANGTRLDYEHACTLTLTGEGDDRQMQFDPPEHELGGKARSSFAHFRRVLTLNDVSAWLSGLMAVVKAVSLRDTGGVYFIPQGQVDTFRKMVDVITGCTDHKVYEVPALQTDRAVEAILAAVLAEADQVATTMETEIDTGDLGARALNTRLTRAGALVEKVQVYEQLLGKNMAEVTSRIEALQAQIMAAILSASAEEE